MRQVIVVAFALVFGAVLELSAQDAYAARTPIANGRQLNQQSRIAHGAANGSLTHAERKGLKAEQRHIRRVKRRAKADGVVTKEEKLRINRKQRRANRHIRRQKHDAQVRR